MRGENSKMVKKNAILVSLLILVVICLFLANLWITRERNDGSRLLLKYGDKGDWTIEEAFDFDQKGCYRRTVTTTRMMKGDSEASVQGIRNGLLKLSDQYKGYVAKLVVEKDKYTTIEMEDLRSLSKKERKELAVEDLLGKSKEEIKNSGYTMYGGTKYSFFTIVD
ncbi:hypothetical protein SAMN02910400_02666 [Lachnospiraceae bacterium C10]|nr:hypothetical protein SAMN02910400_02666 [Lachnospiraceae bacterium C10]